MFSSDSESSIQSNVRYYYWLTALNRLWNAPVLGLGYGGIENIMYGTFQGGNPHSSYISILLNQGAVGLFLLAVLLIISFVALKRALSEDKYTLRPLLVVFLLNLISMMTDTVIYGEMFTCLIPVAFLAIYTSGLRPKSLECSPHFSSRRYPVAAQSSFNYQKPAFADERFQPTTDEACCGFTRSKHG
jgi:O-antigen ligase